MAVSVSILAIIISLHLIAFVFAVGAERRRSTAKIVPDEYDERTYRMYASDASTVYGLSAFGLLLITQTVLNGVTRIVGILVLCCVNMYLRSAMIVSTVNGNVSSAHNGGN